MPSLSILRERVYALPGPARLRAALDLPGAEVTAGTPPGARPAVLAALARQRSGAPLLAVTATGREAEDLTVALAAYLGPDAVAHFPSWETLPHERLSPRSDTVGQRLSVLRRLAHPEAADAAHGLPAVVVAPVRAVLQPVATGLGDLRPVALAAGDEVPLGQVVERLADAAYARTDLVERRGEFAVRGGILDVFPPTEEHPLRVEFWGDTVEEIRWFTVADQRSLEVAAGGLWAPPCRELLLTESVRARAAALVDSLPGAADILEKLSHGIAVEGMESLTPALVDGMQTVLEMLPEGAVVATCDPERVRTRAHDLVATSEEFLQAGWVGAVGGAAVPIDLESVLGTASFRTVAELRAQARQLGIRWCDLTPFGVTGVVGEVASDGEEVGGILDLDDTIDLGLAVSPSFRGDTDAAVAELRALAAGGWSVLAVTEGPGLAKRVAEMLAEHDVPSRLLGEGLLEPGLVTVTTGAAGPGFLAPGERLAVVTEADLTGAAPGSGTSTKDMRRMPSRRRNQVDPLQLRPGDHVVHEQHGVGRFVEMVQRAVQGATREYLVLEYAPGKRGQPGDRLYVPTDQLDQVTRYVGGEQPTLNKMGGSDWQQTKGRARRYVKQIAAELIRLYSARMATRGRAFAPDTPWQRELEDAFAHVETPDQLSTIDEVKADMEREVPMDRLVCGDVGYGKTEIAVRAAFKAVQDGTQVVVLCPTTILVQQHVNTFAERYAGFPVVVKGLSR
ncbi:MAG: CarD family transcriptional regulator, partial [Dermatophilaceae bacterium]